MQSESLIADGSPNDGSTPTTPLKPSRLGQSGTAPAVSFPEEKKLVDFRQVQSQLDEEDANASQFGSECDENEEDDWMDGLDEAAQQFKADLVARQKSCRMLPLSPKPMPHHLARLPSRREVCSDAGTAPMPMASPELTPSKSGRFQFNKRGFSQPGLIPASSSAGQLCLPPGGGTAAVTAGGSTSPLDGASTGPPTPERSIMACNVTPSNSSPQMNRRSSHNGGGGLMPSLMQQQISGGAVEQLQALEVGRGRVMMRQSMSGSGNYVAMSVRNVTTTPNTTPSFARPTTSSALAMGFSPEANAAQNQPAKRVSLGRLGSARISTSGSGLLGGHRQSECGGLGFAPPRASASGCPPPGGPRNQSGAPSLLGQSTSESGAFQQAPISPVRNGPPSPQNSIASQSATTVLKPFLSPRSTTTPPLSAESSGQRGDLPQSPQQQPQPPSARPLSSVVRPFPKSPQPPASPVDPGSQRPVSGSPLTSRTRGVAGSTSKSSLGPCPTTDRPPGVVLTGALTAAPPQVPKLQTATQAGS